MTKRISAVLGAVFFALLLAGCVPGEGSYALLEREAEPGDALSAAVLEHNDEYEVESARFAGERDGVQFWLVRMDTPNSICLAVYPNDTEWVVGCGAEGGLVGVGGPSGEYMLLSDHAPAPEGTTQVTKNAYVVGD